MIVTNDWRCSLLSTDAGHLVLETGIADNYRPRLQPVTDAGHFISITTVIAHYRFRTCADTDAGHYVFKTLVVLNDRP